VIILPAYATKLRAKSPARRLSKFEPLECAAALKPLECDPGFLPPEALLAKRVSTKSDVWMLGCTVSFHPLFVAHLPEIGSQVYLLLTGTRLFSESYITAPVETAKQTLAQLEDLLLRSGKLEPSDIPLAASFLQSCLAIDPSKRLTAADLCGDDWIKEVPVCSCGWCGF